jgi:hypothetical protein
MILDFVKNAADAMKGVPRGKRRLRLVTGFDRESVVSLYIQDSGPGITAENKDHIFDPFFTTKPTGMGMGCLFVELSSKPRVATCGLLERVTGAQVLRSRCQSLSRRPVARAVGERRTRYQG